MQTFGNARLMSQQSATRGALSRGTVYQAKERLASSEHGFSFWSGICDVGGKFFFVEGWSERYEAPKVWGIVLNIPEDMMEEYVME